MVQGASLGRRERQTRQRADLLQQLGEAVRFCRDLHHEDAEESVSTGERER